LIEVTLKEGEQIEHALRRFKKKWERAGVLRELRKKAFYIKPSDIRRVEKEKTMRRVIRLSR
jgi:small subunit ribosomal protein S21|tara:strand:- start:534 stop:719 length:186 start_codon:yes stop_codon:yes gene_type:complete